VRTTRQSAYCWWYVGRGGVGQTGEKGTGRVDGGVCRRVGMAMGWRQGNIYKGVERKGRKDAGGDEVIDWLDGWHVLSCLGPGVARASDISWPCARDLIYSFTSPASCRYPSKATNRWIWSHHVFITRTFQINSPFRRACGASKT
jgi:hypothetical protein